MSMTSQKFGHILSNIVKDQKCNLGFNMKMLSLKIHTIMRVYSFRISVSM